MNQKSVVITLALLLSLFSFCLMFTRNQQAADAFSKLAFGTLTGLTAFIQARKE